MLVLGDGLVNLSTRKRVSKSDTIRNPGSFFSPFFFLQYEGEGVWLAYILSLGK